MPFPNEHAARQADPEQFESFARSTDGLPEGIAFILGVNAEGDSEVQSVRADASMWTVEDFRAWLVEHEMEAEVEEATREGESFKIVGQWVAPNPDSAIVYGKIWCPHQKDRADDFMGTPHTKAMFRRFTDDVKAGKVLEMGVNHEGRPTVELRALDVAEVAGDVDIGGEPFHKGDIGIKAELFGERLKAYREGRLTGFSLEAFEFESAEEADRQGEAEKHQTNHFVTTAQPALQVVNGRAQLMLPLKIEVSYG